VSTGLPSSNCNCATERARPKSANFTWHSLLSRTLLGCRAKGHKGSHCIEVANGVFPLAPAMRLCHPHLDVPMQQRCTVHVLKRPEYLVHDVLLVDLFQDVGTDYSMEVCLHILKDKVDVAVVLGLKHIEQPVSHGNGEVLEE
jgi:hypothetical protein